MINGGFWTNEYLLKGPSYAPFGKVVDFFLSLNFSFLGFWISIKWWKPVWICRAGCDYLVVISDLELLQQIMLFAS